MDAIAAIASLILVAIHLAVPGGIAALVHRNTDSSRERGEAWSHS